MSYPGKGRADYLAEGDWNARCYFCGFKFKASQLRRHWQGFYVCATCFETRQPQDFVRSLPDTQTPPWAQPTPAPIWGLMCTPQGSSAVPGEAQPGCAVPGYLSPMYVDNYFTI